MAIRTSDPSTRLIIREALHHEGAGWLDYDRAFRQQAAVDPSLRWNTLLPGLQASTMLSHGTGQGALFCTLCREMDHTRTQLMRTTVLESSYAPGPYYLNTCHKTQIRQYLSVVESGSPRELHLQARICATCQLPHKARDCPRTLTYKQTRDSSQQLAAQPAPPVPHP